jgi:ubiquinone/menaquinone biosynthesis C-methylase UbiE
MPYLSKGDIIDLFYKAKQRGWNFIFSKFKPNAVERTKSAFNESAIASSNWWIIPEVKQRWNEKISGNKEVGYEQFMMDNYFKAQQNLRLISIGSGSCSHEIELASYANFKDVVCVDLSANRMKEAEEKALQLGRNNMKFLCTNFLTSQLEEENFDIVLFHSSLHHFDNIDQLLQTRIKDLLKPNGKLVINEFVGATRLQFKKEQVNAINEALNLIPSAYKTRFKSNAVKTKFYVSGKWRMILADPSECIDSASIMPSIHQHFDTVVEKPYGGNILMHALKDISHHFVELDETKSQVLSDVFKFEDEYLESHASDFVFGIYALNK